MTINKIKYNDVFHKNEKYFLQYCFCVFCEKEIKINDLYYRTFNITCTKSRDDYQPLQVVRVCLSCVKSPKEAEERVIPLLKILNGDMIKVTRFFNHNAQTSSFGQGMKDFYY